MSPSPERGGGLLRGRAKSTKRGLIASVFCILLLTTSVGWCGSRGGPHGQFSILYGTVTAHDDWDGVSFYASDTDMYIVPELGQGRMYAFRFGMYREEDRMCIGMYLTRARTDFSAEWVGIPVDAWDTTWSLDMTMGFLAGDRVRFYGLLGVAWSTVAIKDGNYHSPDDSMRKAEYVTGPGMEFGVGTRVFLTDRLSLDAEARVHWRSYWQAKGGDDDLLEMDEHLGGSGPALSIGLSYFSPQAD